MPNIITTVQSHVPVVLNNVTSKSICLKKNYRIGTVMEATEILEPETLSNNEIKLVQKTDEHQSLQQ